MQISKTYVHYYLINIMVVGILSTMKIGYRFFLKVFGNGYACNNNNFLMTQ